MAIAADTVDVVVAANLFGGRGGALRYCGVCQLVHDGYILKSNICIHDAYCFMTADDVERRSLRWWVPRQNPQNAEPRVHEPYVQTSGLFAFAASGLFCPPLTNRSPLIFARGRRFQQHCLQG